MNFNAFVSWQYAVLLAAAAGIFRLIPTKGRCLFLAAAGIYFSFYFTPSYPAALAAVVAAGYAAGLGIPRLPAVLKIGACAAAAVLAAVIPIVWIRSDRFGSPFAWTAHDLRWAYSVGTLHLLMPVGLALHAFQTIGYVVDVTRERERPETNPIRYAAAVLFFPQLLAGPIEKPNDLLRRLDAAVPAGGAALAAGLQRILWGLFKKAVIADRLAVFVDPVFEHPAGREGLLLLLASAGFAVQIYCDFSGYADMACGSAELLGVRLNPNFNAPFLARSVRDYWRRWHMSFADWIREYVYQPLGGSRGGGLRTCRNLIAAFVAAGLCYGLRWNLVIWAALNAAAILAAEAAAVSFPKDERARGSSAVQTGSGIQSAGVFALTAFFWIFFRAQNLSDAVYIATHWFAGVQNWWRLSYWNETVWNMGVSGFGKRQWGCVALFTAVLWWVERGQFAEKRSGYLPSSWGTPLRWAGHSLLLMSLLFFGVFRHQFQNI